MAAEIEKLISVTPAKQGRKAGFKLEWDDSPRSPTWLSNADFKALRDANGLGRAHLFDKALQYQTEIARAKVAKPPVLRPMA